MAIDQILHQCKTILRDYYGSRFQGLVLYGSRARNQADAESDIDLLVLLNQPVDYSEVIRRIVDLLYPIQLESDRLVSAKPGFLPGYEQGRLQLYRSARKEGLLV